MTSDKVESGPQQMALIEEHPLPVTRDEAEALKEDHPEFRSSGESLHPDEIHDRYKDVIAQNHTWRVFTTMLTPGYVFVWNHQTGYGFRVEDTDGEFRTLVDVMMRAAEVVA